MVDKQQSLSSQIEKLEDQIVRNFLKKNQYEYQRQLGYGDFSQVIEAYSLKCQCLVAVKVLKKFNDKTQIGLSDFDKEIQILQKLKNEKYVLQIIDKIIDDELGLSAIVTELCDSNLTTILELNRLDYEQTVALAFQLVKGLLILSEKGIIHGDIKPDNILYSKSKNQFLLGIYLIINLFLKKLNENMNKTADYGLSKIMKDPSQEKTLGVIYFNEQLDKQLNFFKSLQGNLKYQSPEVVNLDKPFTITVDVFSIGIILIEAFIQRRLQGNEWLNLKNKNALEVFPFLQNSPQSEFVNRILFKMVELDKNVRLKPINLIQNLNFFSINEDSLKSLKVFKDQSITQSLYSSQIAVQSNRVVTKSIDDVVKLASMNQILEINLQSQNLEPKDTKKIAASLETCNQLTSLTLDLSFNEIRQTGAKNLATSLKNCQNLSSLSLLLKSNKIGAEGAKHIGASLKNIPNVSSLTLDLSDNELEDEGVKNLMSRLEKCQNIKQLSLDLSQNGIKKEGISSLGTSLEKSKHIIELDLNLRMNSLKINATKSIGKSLENCSNLKKLSLNLSYNQIEDNATQSFFESLEECQNLNSLNLDLSDNEIGEEGAKQIGITLKNLKSLTSLGLCLSNNGLKLQGAKKIAQGFEQSPQLIELNLNLSSTKLNANGVKIIGESLEKCLNLKSLQLDLRNNEAREALILQIGQSLRQNVKFTKFELPC